jgi:hypothetical protein
MKRALLTAVCFALLAEPARASRDIRVVLDLSKSMRTNDPGRLAILSTVLLHDLARPNPSLGDSFEVIPFDLNWRWTDPAAAPPASTQPRIAAQLGRRRDFVQALQALPYDAAMTYFYPGIAAALRDLEQRRAGPHDIRTIVLVTDGVPEAVTRDAELQHIQDELAPRLEQHGIRLYVLAFGAEADKNRDFFSRLLMSSNGASIGEFFVDPNGEQLLTYMLQLFSRSFGFSPDAAQPLPGTTTLDLENATTPERVAVAVLSKRSQQPRLRLTPPAGGSVNTPDGVQSATTSGGSYSLLWVLSPHPGDYGLDSDAIPGTVAVLRPTRLTLEVLPQPPHKQVDRALAGTPFPLKILVRSPTGAQGDPGPVDLSFRTFGERTATGSYAWESDRNAPPAGIGTSTTLGRTYDIVAEFPEDPEKPTSVYAGYIEIEARRGEAVVGALTGSRAHRVEVHPPLDISPLPLSDYASPNALERRQQGCTQFQFHLNAGRLPHPDRPQYPIRAVLSVADPAVLQRELNQASFTFDGLPLEIEGSPGPQPGHWYKGRPLTADEVLREHELCVRIGKPTGGDPSRPLELKLVTTLHEDPYDEFGVIRPFNLKVLVAPPTLFERWQFLFVPAVLLLSVLAFLWYLRDRPEFPRDLGYALAREDSTAGLASRVFKERSPFARLFGWITESAIVAPGEDRPLGRIRPVDQELFQLRPARNVRVEAVNEQKAIPLRRGRATVAVRRTYRLRTDQTSYLFRMEYQQ